ncbi:hypothetical protein MelnitzEXVC044M_143 [Methylophilales phage Melnitz EXVC044M]|nr:hypothetical protein Melnitz1EXVC043M_142 [Methylophilales phage Melnitz-1 EXVC043M]QZI94649.1 hypothetical protein Melnitz2EXVC040M_143 [Methylophilales phage Melnitz-2 EXVC040M]QZI94871.1 hypothetical protein MelnitzEXVC044M_143 [Methylophilales phage Melnitz EXVC044M]QZI95092.1 hypothetical protein Melnitz3EXVC039M_143 [Methylophilales phage Melnitz-3 EXVC039M]
MNTLLKLLLLLAAYPVVLFVACVIFFGIILA